jgi:hypothetical protein
VFHILLSLNGAHNCVVVLTPNKALQPITTGETRRETFAMLPNTTGKMACHASIESSVGLLVMT